MTRRGEIALVTGANKGIGREIARRLAAEGMTVYLGARDPERGRSAERELACDGADVRILQLDVTDQAQVDAAPLRRRSTAARVVNLSSPLGSLNLISDQESPSSARGLLAYSSSKTALNSITVLYANALREAGIRVNAANPGLVATDLNVCSPFGRGARTPEQGAEVPVRLALLGTDGPTGAFRGTDDGSIEQSVPW